MPIITIPTLPRRTLLSLAIASLCPSFAPTAFAQAETLALEEVIVTARKREEGLMDTPVSVVAVSGDNLDTMGITNMEQLSEQVPGLQLGRAAQTSNVFIRGIGSGTNRGFEQSVGMYLDGVYQPRSGTFTQSFVDLQQVEVLRGPQSILFGKNTVAGAIKVESASPVVGDEFNGYLALDVEPEYSTGRGTAVLSGSVTDTLAARLAVRYQESDGYVENIPRDADEAEREDTLGRLTLVWAPSDTLNITAKASRVELESKGAEVTVPVKDFRYLQDPGQLLITAYMGTIAASLAEGFAESTDEYDGWSSNPFYAPNGTDEKENESTQLSLLVDWELGDYTLNSLTAYSEFEEDWAHDVDFTPGNSVHAVQGEDIELWSQEFRLSSNFDSPVNFVAGLYYEEQELSAYDEALIDGSLGGELGALPANAFNPALPPIPLSALGINSLWNGTVLTMLDPAFAPLIGTEIASATRYTNNDTDSETLAAFFEVSWDITDDLTLELGGRYSEDEKKVHKSAALGDGMPGEMVVLVDADGSLTQAGLADPARAAMVSAVMGPLLSSYPHDQRLKRSEDHFDPSAKLIWNLNDDTMIYLSYAEGYKSGGFNYTPDTANPDGSPGDGTEFEDEEATAYELGIRSSFMDGRGRVRATLFQTELEELQVTFFRGTEFLVGNAAEMTSRGVEVDTEFAATSNLTLGLSLAYLDSEFDSFDDAPCTVAQIAASGSDCTQDLSGQSTPHAPEWSGSAYADYSMPLGESFELLANIRVNYSDELFLTGDLDENTLQDSYTKINARLALASLDGDWEVALYGRNLTDEATYSHMVDAPASAGLYAGWVNEPRILGVQARYNF